jgi:putative hydrolase of the HAD superfamily
MLKAVGFDLWETLISDVPSIAAQQERHRIDQLRSTLADLGFTPGDGAIDRAHREAWSRCFDRYWRIDLDIPSRVQVQHFLESLSIDPASVGEEALARLEHAYVRSALDIPPAVVAGAEATLSALKARGLRIGLISNTGRTPGSILREVLRRNGLDRYIDAMVFSNEHGECKPKASIFEKLRSSLGVDFDQMLFVGDHLYVDVYGAQQSGMVAVHFSPPERGTAIAPTTHEFEVTPDATIERLEDLLPIVETLSR